MPNQISFDVQFSKSDILKILKSKDTTNLIVSGTYSYHPEMGTNVWLMNATAEAAGSGKKAVTGSKTTQKAAAAAPSLTVSACIRPCPGS